MTTTGEHVLQAAWVVLKVALYADDEAEAARRQLQRLNDPTAHAVEEVGVGYVGDGALLCGGLVDPSSHPTDRSTSIHPSRQGPAIAPMRALILDGDGATLVMGRRHWGLIRESGLDHLVEVAPHGWRAFEVRCALPCLARFGEGGALCDDT